MPVAWNSYWDVGFQLNKARHDRGSDAVSEIFLRTGVNRAYYGCFHRALEVAVMMGYRQKKGVSHHHDLWSFYRDQRLKKVYRFGSAMHLRRKDADYQMGVDCPDLDDQVDDGTLLLEELRRIEQDRRGAPTLPMD